MNARTSEPLSFREGLSGTLLMFVFSLGFLLVMLAGAFAVHWALGTDIETSTLIAFGAPLAFLALVTLWEKWRDGRMPGGPRT